MENERLLAKIEDLMKQLIQIQKESLKVSQIQLMRPSQDHYHMARQYPKRIQKV